MASTETLYNQTRNSLTEMLWNVNQISLNFVFLGIPCHFALLKYNILLKNETYRQLPLCNTLTIKDT